jgi:hypothetical protein
MHVPEWVYCTVESESLCLIEDRAALLVRGYVHAARRSDLATYRFVLKGTVSRDFRTLVFFSKHLSLGHWSTP